MPQQITPNLDGLLGKSIDRLCPQGFHDFEANHCAHFVSHVGGYRFGYLCHSIAGSNLRGVSVRVQELFPQCPQVGRWDDLPGTDDDLLVFITARRNVNLARKTIENVPRKHIGIYRGGVIYHYSNSEEKVVKQSPSEVRTRFRRTYNDETVDLFFGTLPAAASPVIARIRRAGLRSARQAMALRLTRNTYTDNSTIGELTVDGAFECYILEDKVRPRKIPGITAIPAGTYAVRITHSPRFQRDLPLLLDVPDFSGIRIHPGNSARDTEGCLLPGRTKAVDFVGESRTAFNALFAKIKRAQDGGNSVTIEIIEAAPSSTTKTRSSATGSSIIHRVAADTIAVSTTTGDVEMELGQLVSAAATDSAVGGISVRSIGMPVEIAGVTAREWLEPVPTAAARRGTGTAALASDLYRVKQDGTNLRTKPAILTAETVIAALPSGHLVRRTGASGKPLWWEVKTVLHGKEHNGFIHSALLTPEAVTLADPLPPAASGSEVTVSEKALQMILGFEGMDQPSRWPGEASGISLGRGYDLGYVSADEFQTDWEAHLIADHIKRLLKAIGKTGTAAKNMAPQFSDIRIKTADADSVFTKATLPKFKLTTAKAFPRITAFHPDAQGALVSLVFNRGAAMQGDRRREMREIRDTVASTTLPMEEKLRSIATSIRSMKRLWPDTLGLRRRRDAEAKLVEEAI